ncbi:MAG TPA: queuosine precursor transporter [Treponemataceae bacterium]|nr:queuosine precursor transporter [Treponemataceae bacterium]
MSKTLTGTSLTPEAPAATMIAVSSIVIIALYAAAQMMADIGSLKIGFIAGLSIDGGTFVYPITFTLRDMIHKRLGKKAARTIIIVCALINLAMALFFSLLTKLPSDPSWGLQNEFASILGPVWRIVLASIAAEVISELLDTEMYHLSVTKITTKFQWARVLFSNVVSVPVDSLIFGLIAFWGLMSADTVWSIILANIIVKGIVTIISIPLIYLI